MVFERSAWLLGRKILSDFVRKNKIITRCYVRHSSAFGPQNPFLSDFDITFFVAASNIDELREAHKQIGWDPGGEENILKHLFKDFIVLPASNNAYRLCERYYPLRANYPMSSWLPLDQETPVHPAVRKYSWPFDHSPESFLSSYMIPVLMGKRRRHIFEGFLFARKIKGDCAYQKADYAHKMFWSTWEALLEEINIWDKFYKSISIPDGRSKVNVLPFDWLQGKPFQERWNIAREKFNGLEEVVSLWVYPPSHFDVIPNVALNLDPTISPGNFKKIFQNVRKAFTGLDYSLFLGTETSMLGRINGLSRVALLEPWLFKYQGVCLLGDPMVKEKIVEPSMEMLREKYREFLLYASYRFLCEKSYPYAIYRLCFTLDHLFKLNTLVLDPGILADIYREEFIPEHSFTPLADTPKLLLSLKEMHGFDLFGTSEK